MLELGGLATTLGPSIALVETFVDPFPGTAYKVAAGRMGKTPVETGGRLLPEASAPKQIWVRVIKKACVKPEAPRACGLGPAEKAGSIRCTAPVREIAV